MLECCFAQKKKNAKSFLILGLSSALFRWSFSFQQRKFSLTILGWESIGRSKIDPARQIRK